MISLNCATFKMDDTSGFSVHFHEVALGGSISKKALILEQRGGGERE